MKEEVTAKNKNHKRRMGDSMVYMSLEYFSSIVRLLWMKRLLKWSLLSYS